MLDWIEKHPGLAGWIQGVGTLVAIAVTVWIARWQGNRDRQQVIDAQIAAAEVVSSSLSHSIDHMLGTLNTLRTVLSLCSQGSQVDLSEYRVKFASLVHPTEAQLLCLAPVVPAAAVALARGSSITRQMEREFEHMASLDTFNQLVFRDFQVQSLLVLVGEAISQLWTGHSAFIDLLAHKRAPEGRHIIKR